MSTPEDSVHVPVYKRLVEEYGDALSQARRAAEQVEQQSAKALDWSNLRSTEEYGTAASEDGEASAKTA